MQDAFQMLALGHHIGQPVQGLLITAIEKPQRYIPKRTCKNCGVVSELGVWVPMDTGDHACPWCRKTQKLKAYEPSPSNKNVEFFRVQATRTTERLQQAVDEIYDIACQMRSMERRAEEGKAFGLVSPNREVCVNSWNRECDFYIPHTFNTPSRELTHLYVPTKDYVNEQTTVEALA